MKRLHLLYLLGIGSILFAGYSCGSNDEEKTKPATTANNAGASNAGASPTANDNPSYDPNRGSGKFTSVNVGNKLDVTMAAGGQKVYDVKCSGCHKLTDEKLVGPGWKGVSQRHKPEWIMNFITNTDEMLDKDPKAQALLEICLVRMPNQSVSDEDARHLLEFMRKNDGVK